jgi:hypothetical protein
MTTPNETPTPTPRTRELSRANEEAENWKAACECEHQDKVWQLEKLAAAKAEIVELKKWKEEDHRMLREQIRVADAAYNTLQLHADNAEKQVAELRMILEKFINPIDEVIQMHSDPDSVGYNTCDRPGEQCLWCENAKEALTLARKALGKPGRPAGFAEVTG